MDTKALQKLSYGLFLISSEAEGRTAGCVVNTFIQVTSSPARATVTINKDNFTTGIIAKSGKFAAAVLAQEATMELIGAFGFHTSADTDKFKDFATAIGENGVPYVTEQVVARFECKVIDQMDAGSHWVFLAEITEAEIVADHEPMTYAYYHQVKRGRTPPKASSYVEEKSGGFRCKICGYQTDAQSIPDDFVCPVCGRGKAEMEPIEK